MVKTFLWKIGPRIKDWEKSAHIKIQNLDAKYLQHLGELLQDKVQWEIWY